MLKRIIRVKVTILLLDTCIDARGAVLSDMLHGISCRSMTELADGTAMGVHMLIFWEEI